MASFLFYDRMYRVSSVGRSVFLTRRMSGVRVPHPVPKFRFRRDERLERIDSHRLKRDWYIGCALVCQTGERVSITLSRSKFYAVT